MKIIKRNYLDTLKKVMGTPDIKVITGVRRSGKSVMMNTFKEYIAREVTNANIIQIDLNSLDFEFLHEYHALNQYVEERFIEGRRNFLFIDEVQMCEGFERTINSLHNSQKYDIYITGSNAFLLSSDLATLFTGRIFPIEIFPFSFTEYMKYFEPKFRSPEADKYVAFDRYLFEGGFAGSYIYDDLPEKYRYIETVYDTLILRDIQQKYKLQNNVTLQQLGNFLLDNISRLTSGRNIANTLGANHKTISAYLGYFCEAFAFYKVKRYDIESKKYLQSQDKYYLCDHAMKYAVLGTKNINYGNAYENIVAIELLRRGYEVYVGTLGTKEIDFVAQRRDEKLYIQVSYDLAEPKTLERELNPLLSVRDAYPKLLIGRTRQPKQTIEGVRVLDIADWLLSE